MFQQHFSQEVLQTWSLTDKLIQALIVWWISGKWLMTIAVKMLKEIHKHYCSLHCAIANTAIHTFKHSFIQSTAIRVQQSHINGITSNLPIMCPHMPHWLHWWLYFLWLLAWYKVLITLMVYYGKSHLSIVFPWHLAKSLRLCVWSENSGSVAALISL